ncbi:hypothetical protein [Neobacillus massiliamazoniensis]|uniref:Uncharacterized protein n=1 Tax=Neobacillus massiliamazoniensis TaxID=1499688 RepID=A0A0U1P4P1_9BACI|nr:hypothetical protein [Neobacillus massiliamazoniensis]CRK85230.1 hypothetical protein BN000_05302 [Neobacillus massiliamazoniensis]
MEFSNNRVLDFSIKEMNQVKFSNELTEYGLLVIPNGHGRGMIHKDVFRNLRSNEGGRASWKRD